MSLIISASELAYDPINGPREAARRREAMYAKGKRKITISLPQPVIEDPIDREPAKLAPMMRNGIRTPFSAHACMPPGGDWWKEQKALWDRESGYQELIANYKLKPIDIVKYVCKLHGINREAMVGPCRQRIFASPRQRAMWYIRHYCFVSLPSVGRALGGRDHTTALWGINKMQRMVDNGTWVPDTMETIKAMVAPDEARKIIAMREQMSAVKK